MERRVKTHSNQWTAFLDYAESNPIILTKKMEGPFGRDTYESLWDEMTNILNSMGYQSKTKDKWQKAVADWKSKTRAKAADIKINLTKTGGGGKGKYLTELEKRLIGILGWASIRGDGNMELGSIQPVEGSDLQAVSSCSNDHNYSFQTKATPLRNVEFTPSIEDVFQEGAVDPLTIQDEIPCSVQANVCKKVIKGKQLLHAVKRRKMTTTNLEKMHEETLKVLQEINNNVQKVADSQNRMCTVHEQLLQFLKNGSS